MTLYYNDDSSYAKTQQLELSSKIEGKNQSDEQDEILMLCEKISQMEKNYIAMEKLYATKIKQLYQQIGEKDMQFKKLYAEMVEIKAIAVDQKKKVEELNKNSSRKVIQIEPKAEVRVKSKSPASTARSNYRKSVNNVETQLPTKSPSPKNDSSKRVSPGLKVVVPKKTTMLMKKNSIGASDSGNIVKNTSSQKFVKKTSPSPKNSYEKSKKILGKVDEVESIKLYKKPATGGLNSFREKAPFK